MEGFILIQILRMFGFSLDKREAFFDKVIKNPFEMFASHFLARLRRFIVWFV